MPVTKIDIRMSSIIPTKNKIAQNMFIPPQMVLLFKVPKLFSAYAILRHKLRKLFGGAQGRTSNLLFKFLQYFFV